MAGLKPISRRDLILKLRNLGFIGPFGGKRHDYMERGAFKLRIPNPHKSDIGVPLLAQILMEAQITREDWEVA